MSKVVSFAAGGLFAATVSDGPGLIDWRVIVTGLIGAVVVAAANYLIKTTEKIVAEATDDDGAAN